MARTLRYNDLVSGGCLTDGFDPFRVALTSQDQQQPRSLGISSPQCCAGVELDITSDFCFPNLYKADLGGVCRSTQALTSKHQERA